MINDWCVMPLLKGKLFQGSKMEALIDDNKIKNLFKQTIIEAIEEKKDVVHDFFMEAMEDIALVRAIEEGESSDNVNRDEIFDILSGKERTA